MDYYKAYDERYKQVHANNELWETTKNTKEIEEIINKYKINKNNNILDLGCGEGRDAIYLLNKGYSLLGVDYSEEAIRTCNKLANNKYLNSFKQFDLIKDKLNTKFTFIYSIAVIHMFLTEIHRKAYYQFIYDHLDDKGYAFIVSMGDGEITYESNIDHAFNNLEIVNLTTGEKTNVVETSCKMVKWQDMLKEIKDNKLKIVEKWISSDIPEFSKCMCVIIKKDL